MRTFSTLQWPFLALLLLLSGSLPGFGQTRLSEVMADNETVLSDEDGEFEDWLEIHYPGPGSIDLEGYFLTDDPGDLQKWAFPSVVVPADGYLVVFASSKNRAASGSELHTNFRINADGDYLALVDPDGVTVVSDLGPTLPEQYPDISYGYQTQGTDVTLRSGRPGFLVYHTPGAANTVIPGPHPLYCDDSLARIEITASQAVWNELQGGSPDWPEGSVDIRFRHGDIDATVTNVGIRGRGNTGLTKHPRSFRISFDSFVPGQDLYGIEKLNLNAEVNDPSTARSKLGFDLGAAAGLPSEYANHVATVIYGPDNHRSGPDGAFFDAVLNNTQPVDDVFVKQRFENTRGNLYKCVYTGDGPANLTYKGPAGSSYSWRSTYELKYQGSTDGSYDDLAAFIDMLNNTPTVEFPGVIREHFAVDDFLKRLAIDVLTSNWDGHWGNWNNFYLYHDPGSGKWNYIPYDLDNTFSIRWIDPPSGDWATQDMYDWGKSSDTPLVTRILAVDEFKHRYSYYMNQMVQTFYRNAVLDPLVYRIRSNQTAALPFGGFGVTNCKSTDRDRYDGDWPNWDYSEYFFSYDFAQSGVPNYYGMTEFVTARRANTLSQLNLQNIGPIVSDLNLLPALPDTNDTVLVTARVSDDVQVSFVNLHYTFDGGPNVSLSMADDGQGADTVAGDGVYTLELPPFGDDEDLVYYVQATDDQAKSTYEPWGGPAGAASVEIGSPYLDLAITEIHYHPHDPEGAERGVSTNAYSYEFIELQNFGAATLDLAGVEFIAGISYTFPAETLAAGERVVLVKDEAAFAARYGAGINISGEYSGKLSNGGESLHLVKSGGDTIHSFAYQDTAPWPTRPDGFGSSLEQINPSGPYDQPANWRASIDHGGSPGSAGTAFPAGVVINEVLTHTDPPLVDTIELHNPTEGAIDLGGWYLSDSDTLYRKYRIPMGTILPANGYVVFNETNHFNISMETVVTDFALDASRGDTLWLLAADAQSNLLSFVDTADFEAAINGEAFGRWPDGVGDLYPMTHRTFGAANTGPRVGPVVIGEFMYHPASDDPNLEFVEVYNGGGEVENLTDWQLTGKADFTFPTNTLLAPGEVLLVLPFDPDLPANAVALAAFRSHYGMGTSEPLAGPFLGSLANLGDTLRLRRPDEPPAEEPAFYPMLLEDEVGYRPDPPWPLAAAGGGASLMRRAPQAWGNDAGSWMVGTAQPGTPGRPPMFDGDADGLPDAYEIEQYGGTNVVGSPSLPDADFDGATDAAEYVAGTSSTNVGDLFEIDIQLAPAGNVQVEFQTRAIQGPGYFGLRRIYDVEKTTQVENPGAWAPVAGYADIEGTGAVVTYTDAATNGTSSTRVKVRLE